MAWSSALGTGDDVVVVVGIAFLITRQFVWRSAEPSRILRLPLILVTLGLGSIAWDLLHGRQLTRLDVFGLLGEMALVSVTGTVMGLATHFRRTGATLQYRLTWAGVGLWVAFIAIRVASFLLASHFGAHVLETSGAILTSFGTNRLASSLVVRRRVTAQPSSAAGSLASSASSSGA